MSANPPREIASGKRRFIFRIRIQDAAFTKRGKGNSSLDQQSGEHPDHETHENRDRITDKHNEKALLGEDKDKKGLTFPLRSHDRLEADEKGEEEGCLSKTALNSALDGTEESFMATISEVRADEQFGCIGIGRAGQSILGSNPFPTCPDQWTKGDHDHELDGRPGDDDHTENDAHDRHRDHQPPRRHPR